MSDLARIRSLTVRRDGPRILLLSEGLALADLPWEAALELAHALRAQAKRAEEIACREQVVYDQAILNRLGIKLGLVVDPRLQQEAMHEAAWNSDLRRYLPGGIRSQEVVGMPTLIRHRPPKGVITP
jgi:hypothetical protein